MNFFGEGEVKNGLKVEVANIINRHEPASSDCTFIKDETRLKNEGFIEDWIQCLSVYLCLEFLLLIRKQVNLKQFNRSLKMTSNGFRPSP